jgi:hypothetical protein
MVRFDKPWPYLEVQKFFSKQQYKIVNSYFNDKIKNLPSNETLKWSLVNPDQVKTSSERLVYNSLQSFALSKFPEICNILEIPIIDVDVLIEFSCFNNACPRGLHTDLRQKYVSCLVYMSDSGVGTELYSTNPIKLEKIVDIKKNKAFIFQRTDVALHKVGDNSNGDYRKAVNLIYVHRSAHE